MSTVTIIDYGIGNILSVKRAFEHCGGEVIITELPHEIENADRLVLPGVGAFADGMRSLQNNGIVEAIRNFTKKERPFLGICLGMQMMLEYSEEFGIHSGLSLIPGTVIQIPQQGEQGEKCKIPHIGWNEIVSSNGQEWQGTILDGIDQNDAVYFVHSFTARPAHKTYQLADCYYNGIQLSAVIKSGYLYGCQFHPEKSGKIGMKIIKNFITHK